jgi:hypothetical protein
MKLNFWQWLGIIIFIVGAIGYIMFRDDNKKKPALPGPPPATQPVP